MTTSLVNPRVVHILLDFLNALNNVDHSLLLEFFHDSEILLSIGFLHKSVISPMLWMTSSYPTTFSITSVLMTHTSASPLPEAEFPVLTFQLFVSHVYLDGPLPPSTQHGQNPNSLTFHRNLLSSVIASAKFLVHGLVISYLKFLQHSSFWSSIFTLLASLISIQNSAAQIVSCCIENMMPLFVHIPPLADVALQPTCKQCRLSSVFQVCLKTHLLQDFFGSLDLT